MRGAAGADFGRTQASLPFGGAVAPGAPGHLLSGHTLSYTAHRSKYTYDSVGFRGVVSITGGLSVPADKPAVIGVLGLCVSPEVRGIIIEIAISMPLHWHLDLG